MINSTAYPSSYVINYGNFKLYVTVEVTSTVFIKRLLESHLWLTWSYSKHANEKSHHISAFHCLYLFQLLLPFRFPFPSLFQYLFFSHLLASVPVCLQRISFGGKVEEQ